MKWRRHLKVVLLWWEGIRWVSVWRCESWRVWKAVRWEGGIGRSDDLGGRCSEVWGGGIRWSHELSCWCGDEWSGDCVINCVEKCNFELCFKWAFVEILTGMCVVCRCIWADIGGWNDSAAGNGDESEQGNNLRWNCYQRSNFFLSL